MCLNFILLSLTFGKLVGNMTFGVFEDVEALWLLSCCFCCFCVSSFNRWSELAFSSKRRAHQVLASTK